MAHQKSHFSGGSSLVANIFIDRHHQGLAHSFQLLFEQRLGHRVFFPLGLEWYEKGYWGVYPNLGTAKQYLEIGTIPKDGTQPLTHVIDTPEEYSLIEDSHHHAIQKGITFEQFMNMDIDIVIASIPQHIKPFKELAKMKGAKFIFQMGNVFDVNLNDIPNLMANTFPGNIPPSINVVQYMQEFELDIFKPTTMSPNRLITSFINVYDHNRGYENFMALKASMPSWEFRSYGGQCKEGAITGIDKIAAIMQKSAFVHHVKAGADGYGYGLFCAFACGTPVIINYEDYKSVIGGKLLIPDETCIVSEIGGDMEKVREKIENIPPLRYQYMRASVEEQFKKVVNFDEDENKIRQFMANLI